MTKEKKAVKPKSSRWYGAEVKALKGEEIRLYGGDQILDFTFIDDTVSGIFRAYINSLENDSEIFGDDFHFVTGRGVSISELAEMVVKLCDSTSNIITEEPKDFDVLRFTGDTTKARMGIGFKPIYSLEEGLKILKNRLLRDS